MNLFKKIASYVAVFLAVAFIAVGYAAVSDNLDITGSASLTPPPRRGIFIVAVERVSSSGVTDMGVEYVSPTNVKANVNASNGGKITYKITVENTSDVTYWYRGVSAPVLDG